MATSRTGTAKWKNLRVRALNKAKREGITHCPTCNVQLNYDVGRTPNSPEPDHIIPHALGGQDHIDNLRILCRQCNQSKGHRAAPKRKPGAEPLRTSRNW